jgi:hypothetical protein
MFFIGTTDLAMPCASARGEMIMGAQRENVMPALLKTRNERNFYAFDGGIL